MFNKRPTFILKIFFNFLLTVLTFPIFRHLILLENHNKIIKFWRIWYFLRKSSNSSDLQRNQISPQTSSCRPADVLSLGFFFYFVLNFTQLTLCLVERAKDWLDNKQKVARKKKKPFHLEKASRIWQINRQRKVRITDSKAKLIFVLFEQWLLFSFSSFSPRRARYLKFCRFHVICSAMEDALEIYLSPPRSTFSRTFTLSSQPQKEKVPLLFFNMNFHLPIFSFPPFFSRAWEKKIFLKIFFVATPVLFAIAIHSPHKTARFAETTKDEDKVLSLTKSFSLLKFI